VGVVKPGGKRALKVFEWDERDDAEEFAKANKAELEERPGLNTRCESFCSVSQWCEQFKKIKGEEQ
jgi:hypothetical protein